MWLHVLFVLSTAVLPHAQDLDRGVSHFAGCYEVKSLTWSPTADIKAIPIRLKLLSSSRGDGFFQMRSFADSRNNNENFWWWRPTGGDKVRVAWSNGLGGIRGTLKRSKNGDLKGKIKEWCDSRCGWKKRTGTIHLERFACTP